jgi:hypothetical protein
MYQPANGAPAVVAFKSSTKRRDAVGADGNKV